ncbi:hypothetical protein D3C80_1837150 [compost metagenome]
MADLFYGAVRDLPAQRLAADHRARRRFLTGARRDYRRSVPTGRYPGRPAGGLPDGPLRRQTGDRTVLSDGHVLPAVTGYLGLWPDAVGGVGLC